MVNKVVPSSCMSSLGAKALSSQSATRCRKRSSFFFFNVGLLLLLGTTDNNTHAFLQPRSSTLSVCAHPHSGNRLISGKCQWTKLHSTTPHENDVAGTNNSSTQSQYPSIRSLNDALQEIANECSDIRRINFDIISRAAGAEALVRALENDADAKYKPNITTYNTILKIWAKAAHVLAEGNGRGDINDVFQQLDDAHASEELMDVVQRICSAKDAAEHAESILTSIETRYLSGESQIYPDCRGYSIVMDGWNKSRAKDASERIQNMFLKMKTWSTKGVNLKSLGLEGEGLVHTEAEDWGHVKPNAITYSITIESFRQSESESRIGTADDLVASLEREYEETQDPNFKPDIGVANALIKSYMRGAEYTSGGGGKHQKSMISTSWSNAKKIQEVYAKWNKKFKDTGDSDFKPDVNTMTMVIEAYSRCGDVAATETAQNIFDSMIKNWQETGDASMKPSSKTFTAIITAWSKTRDRRSPEKAEELIALMESMYAEDAKQGINSSLAPQSQTYTAAITAWARSLDHTKPQRALRLLKKVSDLYKETKDRRIQPTLYMYNAVIDACAKCYGTRDQQAKALQIAFAVNKAIAAAKMKANHVTYSTLLKAANILLVPGKEKNDVVIAVFEKCKKEGYVDINVFKTLKIAADQNVFNEIVKEATDKNGYVNFDEAPKDWSRNVK